MSALKKAVKGVVKFVKKYWKVIVIAAAVIFTAGIATVGVAGFSSAMAAAGGGFAGFMSAVGSTMVAGVVSIGGTFGIGSGVTASTAGGAFAAAPAVVGATASGAAGATLLNGAAAQYLGFAKAAKAGAAAFKAGAAGAKAAGATAAGAQATGTAAAKAAAAAVKAGATSAQAAAAGAQAATMGGTTPLAGASTTGASAALGTPAGGVTATEAATGMHLPTVTAGGYSAGQPLVASTYGSATAVPSALGTGATAGTATAGPATGIMGQSAKGMLMSAGIQGLTSYMQAKQTQAEIDAAKAKAVWGRDTDGSGGISPSEAGAAAFVPYDPKAWQRPAMMGGG